MIDQADFEAVVRRAALAPSAHNTQGARWVLRGGSILIGADPAAALPVGDPSGRDMGLSCGAAVEATVLALSALGYGATVQDEWQAEDHHTIKGLRLAARLHLTPGGVEDGLHPQLERRFTFRGLFEPQVDLFGWDRADAVLVTDASRRDWLAELNDTVSLQIMNDRAFRRELTSWMRLRRGHPRYAHDGLNREAMGMRTVEALAVPLALGPLWRLLGALGRTEGLVAEAEATRTAPVIACFHRPCGESPVTSGRAYLRMCLEAASLGMAGWPMASLADDARSNAEICERLHLPEDRRLIQVIRIGRPTGTAPTRARRPLKELIVEAGS